MDMDSFISVVGLSLSAEPAQGNPDLHPDEIPDDGEHYLCTLRGRTHEMSFHMTCVSGEGPPEAEDALRYLGSIAVEYEAFEDIEEWAEEFEFDPARPETRAAFEAMGRMTRDLWRLVGDDRYDSLRRDIEIEQAVDMAWAGFVRGRG